MARGELMKGNAMDIEALKSENRQLRRAVEELSFLNELSRAIGSSFNAGEIMQTIIRKSIRAVNAEQGSIILVFGEEDKEMKTLVRSIVSSSEHRAFGLSQNLLGWMQINKKPLNIDDPRRDDRFRGVQWDELLRSVACVPMLVKSKLTGILSVYNKKNEPGFSDDELRFLSIIAIQSAQIVENARLYEEEQALFRFQEEARLAREIQINLLPKSNPEITGYDIAGISIPALSVGGDYYDFIPLEGDTVGIALGDISGKGMAAALLMSNLHAAMRGQSLTYGQPSECIRRTNDLLFRCTDAFKYATLFYGLLNPVRNEFVYTNAGHNPPFFFTDSSKPSQLKTGGPVVGFMEGVGFHDDSILFEPGNMCVIYSDGITEAMDRDENEFGEDKLEALIKENRNCSSSELIEKITGAVNEHSKGVHQSDDMTIVVIRKT